MIELTEREFQRNVGSTVTKGTDYHSGNAYQVWAKGR